MEAQEQLPAMPPLDEVRTACLARAFLYDDEDAFRAGVEEALRVLASRAQALRPVVR